MAYTYKLTLDEKEANALAWIADRYSSAEVLWDGATHEYDEDEESNYVGRTLVIPEAVAHNYIAALPEDNGVADAILPPCAGGTLADKLVALWESIV